MKNNTEITAGRTTAIVAYITFIGLLIAYSMNQEPKNKFAAFHIRQALGLTVIYFLLMISTSYLGSVMISGTFFIMFFVLWLYAIINASQGKMKPIPLLGTLFQKLFGGDPS